MCILEPPTVTLCGVSGNEFSTLGTTSLDLYIAPDLPPLSAEFYVLDAPHIPADILLGNPTLAKFNIDIYPRLHGVYYHNRFLPRMLPDDEEDPAEDCINHVQETHAIVPKVKSKRKRRVRKIGLKILEYCTDLNVHEKSNCMQFLFQINLIFPYFLRNKY